MRRWLSATAQIEGAGAVLRTLLEGDPGRWLPLPAAPLNPARWEIAVRWGPVARTLACELGVPRREGLVVWRHLRWHPEPDAGAVSGRPTLHRHRASPGSAPPRLEAELAAVPADVGLRLLLSGSYVGPYGVLGVAGEALTLHQTAQGSVDAFLADVALLVRAAAADPRRLPDLDPSGARGASGGQGRGRRGGAGP